MSAVYNAAGGRELRLDSLALGEVQPWSIIDRGLEYPGEVIVAETVNPTWGQPLEGDACFRIIFYTVPRRIPAGQIRDPRIAMAVPRRSADPTRERLSREIQAIHETRERYITGRDPETEAVRSSMEDQEASLLGELARREVFSYSQGRIYSQAGTVIRSSEIFVDDSAKSWVERLAGAVFRRAYPTLPFESDEFPDTLTADVIEAIYRGIFQGDHDSIETLTLFGPLLGLTTPEAPGRFDAGESRVVQIIEEELGSRGGEMPAQDLLQLLCFEHGLNRTLATLYALAYVRQAHAEVELDSAHSLQLREGGPFLSDRITQDLLPEVSFTGPLADQLGTLRTVPSLVWNAVLPYSSLLAEGLQPTQDPIEIAEQEGRLLGALEEMGRRIEGPREQMKVLSPGFQESDEAVLTPLDQLQILCASTGYRGFHTVAVGGFGGPSGLRRALDLYNRLERLSALAPAITQARLYLDEMTFGGDHQDLALMRDSVAGRLGLDSLLGNPGLWSSVEESFLELRREYSVAYLAHHARYHQEAVELVSRMERVAPQVDALARFNEFPEFGGPLVADLPERFQTLMASLRTCENVEDELSLNAAPRCQECLLSLNEDVPRREAARVFRDVERAMRMYNRRLGSEGVRRILAQPTREQLDKFISLVRVSDLSSLANVLDDKVVEFLRRFVREA